jgi:hypothetical protein
MTSFFAVLRYDDDNKGELHEVDCQIDLPFYTTTWYAGKVVQLVKKIGYAASLMDDAQFKTVHLQDQPEPLNQYAVSKYNRVVQQHNHSVTFVIIHNADVKSIVLHLAFQLLFKQHDSAKLMSPSVLYKQVMQNKLVIVDEQLEQVKHVMCDNIDLAIAQAESLDKLMLKSAKLKEASGDFKDEAEKLNSCWKRWFGNSRKKLRIRSA